MKRRDEALVGVLVTVATFVLIIGTLWLARGGLEKGYPLYARFPWGAGLTHGQPVKLAGFDVGYVDDIQLHQDGWLDVTMRIQGGHRIPVGSVAAVEPAGIFGDMMVALRPPAATVESYAAGDTIPVGPSAPTMQDVISKLDAIVTTVSDVTEAVELQLVRGGGMAELRQTVAATNLLVNRLNVIASEQQRQLAATTAALRRAVSALDSASIHETVVALRESSENMSRLTGELSTASSSLVSVLAKVDTGAGTAGRLVNDPALYEDVRALVTRLDSLTTDLKANPGRYIKFSIF